MMFQLAAVVCGVHFFYSTQLCCQALELNMMADSFDDQYISCKDQMEQEVPEILAKERKYNPQLDDMWERAAKAWSKKKKKSSLNVPALFKDEYGVAVVLYTMERPYSIYSQLNGNISIRGASQDDYMKNFHFKALHFYLTRALQVLRKGCAGRFTTYRGIETVLTEVTEEIRFGRFASSSQNQSTAAKFGRGTFFTLSTCFGADINHLSDHEEQEVLIPVAEKFRKITKSKENSYTLESTGQLCSYFNCAYLGEKKRETPVCSSDPGTTPESPTEKEKKRETPVCSSDPGTTPESPTEKDKKSSHPAGNSGTFLSSGSRTWFFFFGLIVNVIIIQPH